MKNLTKKGLSLLAAAALSAVLAVPALAIDYAVEPDYQIELGTKIPATALADIPPKIVSSYIEALQSGKNPAPIVIDRGATLEPAAIAELAAAGAVATFESLELGYQVQIDFSQFPAGTILPTLNLYVDIGAQIPTELKGTVPTGAFLIVPAMHGEYGFDLALTVSADVLTKFSGSRQLALYYAADSKDILFETYVPKNRNGSVTFTISHASGYFLEDSKTVVPNAIGVPATIPDDDVFGDAPANGINPAPTGNNATKPSANDTLIKENARDTNPGTSVTLGIAGGAAAGVCAIAAAFVKMTGTARQKKKYKYLDVDE